MITTADGELAAEARIYRDQGKAGFLGGDHVRMGYAWRMSELHAAVALVHLRRLDEAIITRRRGATRYDRALADAVGCHSLAVPDGSRSNYYKYVALLDPDVDRSQVKRMMAEAGVSLSGEVYATPLHKQPVLAPWADGSFPVADDICARHICLPLHSDMTEDEVDYVTAALEAVLSTSPTSQAARS
jgi:dTDP-4-amino-4,6-dideoxygalactose transaminase